MGLQSFYKENVLEAGTDEAGRGCLAGPVVAAAVILPTNFKHPYLNDSKQLSEKKRKALVPIIKEKAIAYGIAFIAPKEIDRINILQASILAMHKSLEKLKKKPEHIIVDGNKFHPYLKIPHTTIIKGDGKFLSIAAASILAKTYRDEYMEKVSKQFPEYLWHKNKGYPTKEHREAIQKYGSNEHHRKSFTLLPKQFRLDI